MTIHHIGYLVDSIENAASEFEKLGFLRMGEVVQDSLRDVYILLLSNAGQIVELVQPICDSSPVYTLRKRYRNSPYHICYETENIQGRIEKMVKIGGGYTLIQPAQPAPAIPGCPKVAFLVNRHIGIVELMEER